MRLIVGLFAIAALAQLLGLQGLVFVAVVGAVALTLAGAVIGFVLRRHSSER